MIRTFVIPLGIVLIFVAGAVLLIATAPALVPSSSEPIPLSVRVSPANPETIRLKVHSQGSVMPSTESQLIPEVSGRVEWISPSLVAGGYFEEGDVLARVDRADYVSARDRARAALVRANAELEHARYEHNRQTSLAERKLNSRAQLENALRALRVAQAATREARASFEKAEQDLARTELIAPFTGLTRSESVDIGQFISRGNAIATLYASDAVEVRLPIADRQLAFLNLSPTARGELPASEQPAVKLSAFYAGRELEWSGNIVRTEAEIDITSRMVHLVARIPLEDEQPLLSVGLYVEAEIEGLSAENIVVLPRSALRNDDKVLLVDGENKLRTRDVDVLRLYQDDVLIRGGLEAGEQVVLSTIQTPIDGMTVEPVIET